MSRLFINKLAVLFCQRIDEQNGFETIVCNPQTEELLKVNKSGYFLLKTIEDNPGITRQELGKHAQSTFLEQMIREQIIQEKAA